MRHAPLPLYVCNIRHLQCTPRCLQVASSDAHKYVMDPSDLAEREGLHRLEDVPETAEDYARCFRTSALGEAVNKSWPYLHPRRIGRMRR